MAIPTTILTLPVWQHPEVSPTGGIESNVRDLWIAERPMMHLPAVGQQVTLWPSDDGDPIGGPAWTVTGHIWDALGRCHISLSTILLNPPDEVAAAMHRAKRRSLDYGEIDYRYQIHRVPDSVDPAEKTLERDLKSGGWWPYSP